MVSESVFSSEIGEMWYSNGIDTYEVGVLRDGKLCYDTGVLDDDDAVTGYQTEDDVTMIMKWLQEFPANIEFEKSVESEEENDFCEEKEYTLEDTIISELERVYGLYPEKSEEVKKFVDYMKNQYIIPE